MEPVLSWKEMVERINESDEETLRELINAEVESYKRPTIIYRMHARYSKLRARRERFEMMMGKVLK